MFVPRNGDTRSPRRCSRSEKLRLPPSCRPTINNILVSALRKNTPATNDSPPAALDKFSTTLLKSYKVDTFKKQWVALRTSSSACAAAAQWTSAPSASRTASAALATSAAALLLIKLQGCTRRRQHIGCDSLVCCQLENVTIRPSVLRGSLHDDTAVSSCCV
ncbi:g2242 [Coccomyxa elongata]